MNRTFYHGTSVGTGLEDGDRFNPSYSQFEPCVWGTASLAYAKYWASSRDAHYDQGEVIFEVVLDDDAKVLTLSEDNGDTIAIIEKAKADGYDAVIFEDGEDNAPMIAILNAYTALAKLI